MRRHDSGTDAAPALVPRKHEPGTPRVAVRAHYEGLPYPGWTGQDERGESRGIRGGNALSACRKNGPGERNRRGGALRGARPCATDAAPHGVG